MEKQNFLQVVEMSDDEKFDRYMKIPHEELVRMKIEEEKFLKMIEPHICYVDCKNRTFFN